MFQLREAYSAPIVRPRLAARSIIRVGAEPDVWVVVSTTMSRDPDTLASKQDLKVGDVVRFTAQYGLRPKDDDGNIIVIRGTIASPRTPLLPDSYGVRFDEVAKSHNLDPSVSLPFAGQVFLVAPWSIAAVEKATAPAPESTTESYSTTPPAAPVVSSPTVMPDELAGTAPADEPPAKSSTMTYVSIGAIVALAAVLFFVVR